MLVSAAMLPERKSYGKAEISSDTELGRSDSDRMIASPRKMCVPGVHAYAAAGVTAIAMTATPTTHSMKTAGCLTDSRPNLDTDPLPLTANGLPEIVHLRAHDVVDRLTRAIDVLAYGFRDFLDRKRIDQLFAALTRYAIASRRPLACPACRRSCAITSPASAYQPSEGSPLCAFARCREKRRD